MRLPRVQFSVRLLMGAVAAVALAIVGAWWVGEMIRLRRDDLEQAAYHAERESLSRSFETKWYVKARSRPTEDIYSDLLLIQVLRFSSSQTGRSSERVM